MYAISEVTPELIVEILAHNPLQPFNEYDWNAFCGAETKYPEIAYQDNLAIIKDGSLYQIIDCSTEYMDAVDFSEMEIELTKQLYAIPSDNRRFDGR